MVYSVLLTDKAEADVEAVLHWFHQQHAADAGRRWYTDLLVRLNTLEEHPDRCPLARESDEVGQEIRELLLGRRSYKYRLLFRIVDQTVQILRVWHSSRDAINPDDL